MGILKQVLVGVLIVLIANFIISWMGTKPTEQFSLDVPIMRQPVYELGNNATAEVVVTNLLQIPYNITSLWLANETKVSDCSWTANSTNYYSINSTKNQFWISCIVQQKGEWQLEVVVCILNTNYCKGNVTTFKVS